jgi:hypothetical protein
MRHSGGPHIFVYGEFVTKFKNILKHESGAYNGLFDEIKRGRKSRDTAL